MRLLLSGLSFLGSSVLSKLAVVLEEGAFVGSIPKEGELPRTEVGGTEVLPNNR